MTPNAENNGTSRWSLILITVIVVAIIAAIVIDRIYASKRLSTFKIISSTTSPSDTEIQSTDAISHQIALLGLIITTVTLGGAGVAIIGYQGLKSSANRVAKKTATKTAEHVASRIALREVKKALAKMDANKGFTENKSDIGAKRELNKLLKSDKQGE